MEEQGYRFDETANIWIPGNGISEFSYSDGDGVEDNLAEIIAEARDRSVYSSELAGRICDWPTLYHLSSQRANLLRPLADRIRGPLLEIGAGCGALTRFLGELGIQTIGLEGSVRRAKIAAERCRDLKCVAVVADTLRNFEPNIGFRTVTLIGVLEYARLFPGHEGARDDEINLMLGLAKDLLRPEGVLILAIENQLGLKYLSGYPEDHLGESMVGIEDCYRGDGVVTFGRMELEARLRRSGLSHQRWWFPFPDYKLPISVVSESGIDGRDGVDFSPLAAASAQCDAQRPAHRSFSLKQAWRPFTRNGLMGALANSFLVVASRQRIPIDGALAYHYGPARARRYAKEVVFRDHGGKVIVERRPLYREAEGERGADGLRLSFGVEPYVEGRLWTDRLEELLNRDGWSGAEVAEWAQVWLDALFWKLSPGSAGGAAASPSLLLPGGLIDAIPQNLILGEDGGKHFIDLEWRFPGEIELGYLIFRALHASLTSIDICSEPDADTPLEIGELISDIIGRLGFRMKRADFRRYWEIERSFQEQVSGLPFKLEADAVFSARLAVRETAPLELSGIERKIIYIYRRARKILGVSKRAFVRGLGAMRRFASRACHPLRDML